MYRTMSSRESTASVRSSSISSDGTISPAYFEAGDWGYGRTASSAHRSSRCRPFVHLAAHRGGELRRGRVSTEVARADLAGREHAVQRGHDPLGRIVLVDVTQHHER